ncbi:hypothetical protein [Pseudonocardia lacus]|uniref:hypothetical protein n=1 Tax=Pseudonocardia lacus TaxID=2835865 RepID=UPI001BDD32BD|nr:hypothetical protein [Pseudonocardia lacus]
MTHHSRKTPPGLLPHLVAAWHGWQAGRAGLGVEEVVDTRYLVRLRRDTALDLVALADQLDRDLAALADTGHGHAGHDSADVRSARRDALVRRADAAAEVRVADYELVCATYGRNWQRHHRYRRHAHLGWRCPPLAAIAEVDTHETR